MQQFSPRHSQSRADALSAALRLPLLIIGRSLSQEQPAKIRASTIFAARSWLAELLYLYIIANPGKEYKKVVIYCDYADGKSLKNKDINKGLELRSNYCRMKLHNI
ncbi:MAG: hypothetical protein Q4C65_03865 [Eubacteriales bacterium]|nr:hypothetical protein [Eubacteriales bacterium]